MINRTNSYSPSFGSFNVIQIPKAALSERSLKAVQGIFKKEVFNITGYKEKSSFMNLVRFFLGLKPPSNRPIIFLEHPSYIPNKEILEKNGGYSLRWMKQNTGASVQDELNPNFYSFFVLTKEHAKRFASAMSLKNLIKMGKESALEMKEYIKSHRGARPSKIWQTAKHGAHMDLGMYNAVKGEPVNKFTIDSLAELPEVFAKIDYK